jgi:putative membrane protein
MFKHLLGIGVLSLGVCSAILAFSTTTLAGDTADKATGGSLSSGDLKFVDKAAQGGMTEVKLSELALTKASDTEVKQFAQHMIDDHSKANAELTNLAQTKGVTAPTELDSHHQKMVDELAATSGGDFDAAYVKDMVKDHTDTVDMFQKFAERGDDNDLKTWTAKTLPTLQMHLSMIQGIQSKMK